MSTGKCLSWLPSATSAAASWIAVDVASSIWPSSQFTAAAHPLTKPSARMKVRGKRMPLIGKLSTALCVWALYSASEGTRTSPIESRSILNWVDFAITSSVYQLPDR